MKTPRKAKLPTLTIVAGRPGAGKSTLATALAKRIHCPLISRDAIKEGMVSTQGDKGAPGGTLAADAVATFFDVVALLLERGVSVVADAFFPAELWLSHLGRLKELAKVKVVFCEVDVQLAQQRMWQRRQDDPHWDEFHNAPVDQTTKPAARYEAPELGVPLLVVDCRGEYVPNLEAIFRFAKDLPWLS
jgi:predicted kinase